MEEMGFHLGRYDDGPLRWHVGVGGTLGSIAGMVAGGCFALRHVT